MITQNNFSKKPWIPEFFPRGTIVEFDTSATPESEFGTAGVGTVDTLVRTDFENTVLNLTNVTLTKGEFYSEKEVGVYTLSSSWVTRIVKRGTGSCVVEKPYDVDLPARSFGKHVYLYDIRDYFRYLSVKLSKDNGSSNIIDMEAMVAVFLKPQTSSDKYFAKKRLKKWFMKNYNRFLLSVKDEAVIDYFESTSRSIMLEADLDMLDSYPSAGTKRRLESKENLVNRFDGLLNQQLHNAKWGVLTRSLVEKYLKHGKEFYLVTVNVEKLPTSYFFTDVASFDTKFVNLLDMCYFDHVKHVQCTCQVATQKDLELFEPSEEHGVLALSGLAGFIDFVDYLLNYYDPNYVENTDASGEMDDGYYSMSDFDFI